MFNIDNYRTWAEIDLDALGHNMREIRKLTEAKIMAVIKADGYGHGMVQAYRTLVKNGADCFAAATVKEAVDLRKSGATEPILVLGYVPGDLAQMLLTHDIMPTVFDLESAHHFSGVAVAANKTMKIHIKLDTGMSRIGFATAPEAMEQTLNAIEQISKLPYIEIDGIFSHFSCSDTDREYTKQQYDTFMTVCDYLQKRGVCIGMRHICNSAGIILEKEMHLDMVRPGVILYGLHPDTTTHGLIDLKPVMRWCARITNIKTVKAGTTVSYGNTFTAERDMRIGTVCVGYADGYNRIMSSKAKMLVGGHIVNQIGRICMDQCMIDLTNVHTVSVGDIVTLMGTEEDACISAEQLAAWSGTINYEIVCGVGARVVRVYRPAQE